MQKENKSDNHDPASDSPEQSYILPSICIGMILGMLLGFALGSLLVSALALRLALPFQNENNFKYKIAPSVDFPDRRGDFSIFRVSYSSVMPTVICRQPIPSRNQNMGA